MSLMTSQALNPPLTSPCGIVTLLTDFGLQDPYVGIMKGVMLSILPTLRLVDLTHGISPQSIAGGALALEASWRWFPPGTVHLVVVDPGVGSARRGLLVEAGGHFFVGPDNGVLESALAWRSETGAVPQLFRLDAAEYRLPVVSRTFQGRDVFAPAAAHCAGGVKPEAFGSPVLDPLRLPLQAPEPIPGGWQGIVLGSDVYGNLVTNLTQALLVQAPVWQVRVGGLRIPVVETYSSVASGELLAVVGSTGRLELSVNGGSARSALGLPVGAPVMLEPAVSEPV